MAGPPAPPGLAITLAALADGRTVVAVDREVDRLEEVAMEQSLLVVRRCDLGEVGEVEGMWGWLGSAGLPPLGVLVNNAGVGGCRWALGPPSSYVAIVRAYWPSVVHTGACWTVAARSCWPWPR